MKGIKIMNSQHQQLLGNLAQDYYLSKMAISDISKKYNLSRYLIMKYLDEAFSSGIVDISIHTDYDRNAQLERELSNSFDIKNVYVIKDPSNHLRTFDNHCKCTHTSFSFLLLKFTPIAKKAPVKL